MNKTKELSSFLLLLVIVAIVFVVDTKCKKADFNELRTKELTIHTKGKITGVSKARKSSMLVYSYSFNIGEREYKNIFTMYEKYQGITAGSPVGVIYLKKNPNKSRIIFTDEDFDWIKK